MKVAIVGSGISGLSAAWLLTQHARDVQVTLFESDSRLGGHTNTIDVDFEGKQFPVDTGFLVFNDWTYPNLIPFFTHLDVPTAASDMSFGIKLTDSAGRSRLEWCGSDNLASVFAQPANALRPAFWRMLAELMRFNREATRLARASTPLRGTLGEYLSANGYSRAFRDWYLVPMAACIWSTPSQKIDAFPLATFLRFCLNHGLLSVNHRPQWRTVKGGARQYVEQIAAKLRDVRLSSRIERIVRDEFGVLVTSERGVERFDQLVLACHSDQSMRLLTDLRDDERRALSSIPYQANTAILHTDASLLPTRKAAWAAWNYHAAYDAQEQHRDAPVSLTYLINKLQPVPFGAPVMVTMNPRQMPDPSRVIKTIHYDHPVFLPDSVDAKRSIRAMQGHHHTWFAGAWTRYGFHEDGIMSGVAVAKALGAKVPWPTTVPAANDLTTNYAGIDTP